MSLVNAYLIKGFVLAHNPPKEVTDALAEVIARLGKTVKESPKEVVTISGQPSPELMDIFPTDDLNDDPQLPDETESDEPHPARKARTSKKIQIPPDEVEAVRRMVADKKSDDEIGEAYGCALVEVKAFRREHGISRPKGNPNFRKSPDIEESAPATLKAQPTFEIRRVAKPNPEPAPKPNPLPAIDPTRLITVHNGYAGKRQDGQLVDADWPDIKARLAKGAERRAIASDYDVEPEDLDFFITSNQRREAKQPPGEAGASPLREASDAPRRTTW